LQKQYPENLHLFVWKAAEDISFLENFLLESEKKEFEAISHLNKQIEFAVVRHLAQLICKETLFCPYKGIDKDPYGKPFLAGIACEISISHCLPYVAIALHPSQSVGVDIEREQNKILQVAPRIFSKEEMYFCDASLRKACIVWCCKEALFKIYAKKGLTFQKDLLIDDFKNLETCISAKIQMTNYQQICQLYHLELEKDIHLCCGF